MILSVILNCMNKKHDHNIYIYIYVCMSFVNSDICLKYQPLMVSTGSSDICGSGSSVGIATDYGLDGPGSNPSGDEIFRPSRPSLGPTQSPVKWVPCFSRE